MLSMNSIRSLKKIALGNKQNYSISLKCARNMYILETTPIYYVFYKINKLSTKYNYEFDVSYWIKENIIDILGIKLHWVILRQFSNNFQYLQAIP